MKRLNTPPKLKAASERLKQADIIDMDMFSSTASQQKLLEDMSESDYQKLIASAGNSLIPQASERTSTNTQNQKKNNGYSRHDSESLFQNTSVSQFTSSQGVLGISQESNIYFETGIFLKDLPNHGDDDSKHVKNRPSGVKVSANGKDIALFRFRDKLFAFAASCCHEGARIYDGKIVEIEELVADKRRKRLCVECPRHHFKFDVKTGVKADNNRNYIQPVYECFADSITGEIKIKFDSLDECYFSGEEF